MNRDGRGPKRTERTGEQCEQRWQGNSENRENRDGRGTVRTERTGEQCEQRWQGNKENREDGRTV